MSGDFLRYPAITQIDKKRLLKPMNNNLTPYILTFTVLSGIHFAQGAVLADFDGNGVTYVEGAVEGDGPVGVTAGGPTGSFYQLLSGAASQRNFLAFDSDELDPDDDYTGWTKANFKMDFRLDLVEADGFGINFLDTSVHGHTGGVAYTNGLGAQGVEERTLIPDSFGVGFRTFQATNASVTWDEEDLSGDVPYTLPATTWGSLEITMERNSVTKDTAVGVTLYDQAGQAGVSASVFTDFEIQDFNIEDFRVQVGGRTGGAAMVLEMDNIELDVVIPEFGDADGDGLPDDWEAFYSLDANDNGLNPNNNGAVGDPDQGASGDPDSDTLTNAQELELGTSPVSDDTDEDGLKDNVEDGEGDYVGPDETGTSPLLADTDGDGLKDGVEVPGEAFVDGNQTGTNPLIKDTDEDGLGDGLEVLLGRNPTIVDVIQPSPGLIADFDGNGELFADAAMRGAVKGSWIPGEAPDGNYYALLENVGNAGNFISFESSEDYTDWTTISFQMDVLTANVQADGFGVNFLSTEDYGDSGVVPLLPDSVEERALIENSFGVGFRTFEGTNSTISFNGTEVGPDSPYTLIPDQWVSLAIDVERDPTTKDALVDVIVYDQRDRQGTAENVFTDFAISAFALEDFRVQVAGRTGGSAMDLCLDNIKLLVDGGGQAGLTISAINTVVVPGAGGSPDTLSVTITWNSREGRRYAILASPDMAEGDLNLWNELEDSLLATPGQETTSFTESGLPVDTLKRFYVIRIPE
jgi:hypothetical protein